MYYTSLDRYRVLGEKNNFGEVLTGLYIYDFKIDKIIGFYDSCVFVWGLSFR